MRPHPVRSGREKRVEHVFRPLLVAALVGCVAWSLVQLVLMIAPDWNPTYLLVGCVLVALMAFYSHWMLHSRRFFSPSAFRFRIAELILVFILLKLGRYISMSSSDVLAEIRSWPKAPWSIFDLETMAAFFLAVLFWLAVTQTAGDLKEIGEPPRRREDSASPFDRLVTRFFFGGALLLIAAGLTLAGDASELLNLRRPPVDGLVLNALVYFLLGFVMLGQMHYVRLQERWERQSVDVSEALTGRWVRYSLVFVGLAALIAFVLPSGFTVNPLNSLAHILGAIVGAVAFVFVVLFSIPLGILGWLLSLFFGGERGSVPPAIPTPRVELPPSMDGGGAMSWLEAARALIFWIVVFGAVVFVLRSYLRERPELLGALTALRPVQALSKGWTFLWARLRGWFTRVKRTVGDNIPTRLAQIFGRGGTSGRRRVRLPRLGALSPRERVLYYYLSIVRRAGQQGFPRRHHQTPHEFSTTLESNLPQLEEDIETLTQAFIEARYSRHELAPDQEQRVRANWERVKSALRALKHQAG